MAAMIRFYPSGYSPLRSAAARSTTKCTNEHAVSFSGEASLGGWVSLKGKEGYGSSVRKASCSFSVDAACFPDPKEGEDPHDIQITKEAPPVFLAATAQDMLTNFGAMPIARKYMELGLGYELHIFQHGPHGYSLADETSSDGSSQMMNPAYAKWLDMSADWLHKLFGALTFEDKSTSKMGKYLAELGIPMPVGPGPNHG